MKNITDKQQLKKCIFMKLDNFKKLIKQLLGNNVNLIVDYEGLYFEINGDCVFTGEICSALSKYFDIGVTSIHIDDCMDLGVWVTYKD